MIEIALAAADAADLITFTDRLLEPFRYDVYRVPLTVSTIMGATLGLVGTFVVLRRMALLGDALSHAVLPGVALAFMILSAMVAGTGGIDEGGEIWGLFTGALLAGLLTTLGINLVVRHSRVKEDTAIGIVFTAMFAIGVILVSSFPRGTHFDLKCFLFGEPLAIQLNDLYAALVVSPAVLGLILLFYRPLKLVSFDAQMAAAAGLPVQFVHYLLMAMLSATVVTALQSVGVIMSVAMLITPAAIAYQLTNRLGVMLVLSAAMGAISAMVGIVLAFALNWPPGPAMVLVATVLFGMTMAFAPEYGVIARALRRHRVRRHILEEDVLKSLTRLEPGAEPVAIQEAIGRPIPQSHVEATLADLDRRGLLTREQGRSTLSEAGRERAERLVRSHRLWETYLAEHNIPEDRLHEIAEQLEHAHDVAEEVAHELGHPEVDPHGEPIPRPRDRTD
jgi:manganese/iron transport system permease protein/iron/zinc/copper transport system permease protein